MNLIGLTRRGMILQTSSALATAAAYAVVQAIPPEVLQEPVDEERPVLESSWQDEEGNTHTVRTDCNRYTSTTNCANAHKRAIEILKKVMAADDDNVEY